MRPGGWFGTSGQLKSPTRRRGVRAPMGLTGRKKVITKHFSNWPAPVSVVMFLDLYFQPYPKFFSSSWSCLGIQSENTEKTCMWWSDQQWILAVWSRAGQTKNRWEQDWEGSRLPCGLPILAPFQLKTFGALATRRHCQSMIVPVLSPKSSWYPPLPPQLPLLASTKCPPC